MHYSLLFVNKKGILKKAFKKNMSLFAKQRDNLLNLIVKVQHEQNII